MMQHCLYCGASGVHSHLKHPFFTSLSHRTAVVRASSEHAQPATTAGQKQKQQQQQQQQQQVANDPRLKWARPEWIQAGQQRQQHLAPKPVAQPAGSSGGSRDNPAVLQRRQRLVNKVTYGSLSRSDSDDDIDRHSTSSSSNNKPAEQRPLLFQALGIDFGAHRVGVAVRRSSHNVPLLTLHRQQYYHQQQHSVEDSSRGSNEDGGGLIPLKRTAAAVLHLALREGCDGFVLGLPVFTEAQGGGPAGAASSAADAAAAAAAGDGRWINAVIRAFAQALADLAAPLELPVLLVNEQQSSQQARAVMSGAAAYDIKTLAELKAEAGSGTHQGEPAAGLQRQQQNSPRQQRQEHQKQQQAVGRDAYAAALILSRYYNVLVAPVEQLEPSTANSSGSSKPGVASWASKQLQQQAATDLKYMQVPPAEQRRRQEQRERMKAAAAADAATGAGSCRAKVEGG